MRKRIEHRALLTEEAAQSLAALTRELEDLLTVHPAPAHYREHLRGQLLAAARDENFYRRDVPRRTLIAMSVVVSVLLSVIGLIAWRNYVQQMHT